MEAHTVSLLACYSLYCLEFLELQPDEETFLKETSTLLREAYHQDINKDARHRHNLTDAVTKTIDMFKYRFPKDQTIERHYK